MLRSHHHLRGFVKLVLWDVYCVNGYGSFRLGYVGVGYVGVGFGGSFVNTDLRFYFSTCTAHLFLFCTAANKST